MDKEKISEALSFLDDDIIKETDALRQKSAKRRSSGVIDITRRAWFKAGLAVAALALILIGGGTVMVRMFPSKSAKKDAGIETSSLAQKSFAYEAESDSNGYMSDDMLMSQSTAAGITKATATPTSYISPSSVSEGVGASDNLTERNTDYDMDYISTYCTVTCKDGNVTGEFGFDLSENADYFCSTGESWELQRLNGENWETVYPVEPLMWIMPMYYIGQYPGTNHFSRTFDLKPYGELTEGSYRIAKQIFIHKTVNGSENVYDDHLYCEFEIKF